MKKKIKRYAEGKAVTTRSDDEIEFSSKNPYKQYPGEGWKEREKEQGEKNLESLKSFGRKLFGGGDDESKFSDLESVKKTKTLKEQIGRKDEEEPRRKFSDYNKTDKASTVSEEDAPYKVEKTTPKAAAPKKEKRREEIYPGPNDKRKTQPESTLPKKSFAEDAKPLPGVQKDKSEPKNLPGKSEDKPKESSNYISPKKIQEERSRIAIDKREKTKSPVFPLKEDEDKQSDKYISPKKIQEERRRIVMKKRENDKAALENRKEYGMKKGGSVSSASSRGDGIAMRGKTKGKIY
jgi:hypothetical protein